MSTEQEPQATAVQNGIPHLQIPIEEYSRILSGTELVNVALTRGAFAVADRVRLNSNQESAQLTMDLSCNYNNFEAPEGKFVVVEQQISLNVVLENDKLLTINAVFQVDYEVEFLFTPEFFDHFGKTSLLFQVAPFMREFVYSLTSRMGVPPITLPLVKAAAAPP